MMMTRGGSQKQPRRVVDSRSSKDGRAGCSGDELYLKNLHPSLVGLGLLPKKDASGGGPSPARNEAEGEEEERKEIRRGE